ncbi:hypothetical protein B0H15DRAFT_774458 [Mycena belliarum]|uniref:Zn(2)-C6 fungal-type domain-containing protein n=1 Tax=Mycena belliarum TaxID=1033014 RepID=A0AAD6UEM3_9AGAR|nr:hypothetical protein B0H15DRAFT_774458 [Mycena belliae]
MSRIDTSSHFSRRDSALGSAQPVSATSLDLSPDSEAWSPTAARPRKTRREKPRIQLAPDQPPTTQGKPRARVYVACIQCRTRKIRCDGAKPICHNCNKRSSGGSECNYDPLPKRRGPDKTPGARQRAARKMSAESGSGRSRRRANSLGATDRSPDGTQLPPFSFPSPSSSENTQSPEDLLSPYEPRMSHPMNPSYVSTCACHGLSHCPSPPAPNGLEHTVPSSQVVPYDDSLSLLMASPLEAPAPRAYITDLDDNNDQQHTQNHKSTTIASQPSLEFSRKTWWDSLLALYLSPNSVRLESLSAAQREHASQRISADLRLLFRASNYWFSFMHAPTFFLTFHDPSKRERIQPSLVLAVLAMSTFWQSSEIGLGHHGRQRALTFRDEAQSALEASFNAGWVDDTLAQAAWLLAMFEICAHPLHSSDRSSSAMKRLDSIIRALSLTMVDANDPYTSTFPRGKVPAVASPASAPPGLGLGLMPRSGHPQYPHSHSHASAMHVSADRGCACVSLTLGVQWAPAHEHTPAWAKTPAWDTSWSEAEIRKESCRRLCWSSIILAAGHSNYTFANRSHIVELFISDPSNYALLFSGESLDHSPAAKDTIWALHDRSFLLWHACIKMRNDASASVSDKGQFAIKAWLEADAIEQALNRHTCDIEKAFIYQGREYIFNTRMCITYEFRRFVPLVSANVNGLFHRHKAEEWLSHQAAVARQFVNGLATITGNSRNNLSQRPFFVFWFMAQCARGLTLWQCDNSMTIALDVCKNLLAPIDYLTALWPCEEQRYRYESLRDRLRKACDIAGVSPPPPLNLTLPRPPL